MFDEKWFEEAGMWAAIGAILAVGAFLTIVVIAFYLIRKYIGGL